ncbi:MAG: hypothetical protein QGI05_04965 [Candidatus Omnitrophota bacterium]|jgi:hypothetical protein|nr:hypothetical protein [Candidatus Omnitrophota bacterium]
MKRGLIFLGILIFIAGCNKVDEEKIILARINNYEITKGEFDLEFKESGYGRVDTLESRNEFLNNLVDRKLILQDAQSKGLDKDKSFLKMIERFWEQSLLKVSLDRKSNEIAGRSSVSDKKIESAYKKMVREGKTTKSYDEMYAQLKWEILKEEESQTMSDWLLELHKDAKIKINYNLLEQVQ